MIRRGYRREWALWVSVTVSALAAAGMLSGGVEAEPVSIPIGAGPPALDVAAVPGPEPAVMLTAAGGEPSSDSIGCCSVASLHAASKIQIA